MSLGMLSEAGRGIVVIACFVQALRSWKDYDKFLVLLVLSMLLAQMIK